MSTTSHIVEIKFVVTNPQAITKPLTDINKGTTDLSKSTTDLNKTTKETTNIYSQAQKTGAGYFKETSNLSKSTKDLAPNTAKLNSETSQLTGTHTKVAAAQDKTGTSMGGLTEKFTKFRPLIFGGTGIVTAGIEAVGMWAQYSSASQKVAQAQQAVNDLLAAGQKDTAAMRDAEAELADAHRSQNFALRIMILSFSDLAPMILLSVNAVLNMQKTLTGAKAATDAMTTSTTALANAKKGALIPAVTDFNKIFAETPILTKNATIGFDTMDTSLKKHPKTLTQVSSMYKGFFVDLGSRLKDIATSFMHPEKAMVSFGSKMKTGLTAVGGALKTAGAAVLNFGKAMLVTFLSNPLLLAIAAISAAIGALIFDFGGVRTALNQVGVAIGKAVPALKPLLDILGGIGEALGGVGKWIMGLLGFGNAAEDSGNKAAGAKPKVDSLTEAYNQAYTAGTTFANMDAINNALANATKNYDAVIIKIGEYNKAQGDQYKQTQVVGPALLSMLTQWRNSAEAYFNTITVKTPEVQAKIDDFRKTWELYNANGQIPTIEQAKILQQKQLDIQNTMTQGVKVNKEAIDVKNQEKTVTNSLAGELALLNLELKDQNVVLGEASKQRAENRSQIEAWANDLGIANTLTEDQKLKLLEIAPALSVMGSNLDLVKNKEMDLAVVAKNMANEQAQIGEVAKYAYGLMMQELQKVGEKGLPLIQQKLEIIKALHPQVGEEAEKLFTGMLENMIPVQGQFQLINEAEVETAKNTDKAREKIDEKAKSLGVLNQVQSLTIPQAEEIIKLAEDEQKSRTASTEALKKEAYERGAGNDVLKMSDQQLRTYIMTHQDELDIQGQVLNQHALLISSRQDHEKEMQVETKTLQMLVSTMDDSINTTNMSAEGLNNLVKTLDDTDNALQIATDDVVNWRAELEKNEAVEKATLKQLQEYAKAHGIVIPKEIQKDIDKTKEFIETVEGVGEGAKKAAAEAEKAFQDIASKADSELEGIISDKLGEDSDNIKKAIKGIEKAGVALNSITGVKHLINVYLNDDNIENDIKTLGETMIDEFGRLEDFTRTEGNQIGNAFVTNMVSQIKGKAPETAAVVEQIWKDIQATSSPEETGDQLLGRFAAALNNPSVLAAATKEGLVNPITGELSVGLDTLGEIAGKSTDEIATILNGKKQVFADTGAGLAESAASGYESNGHLFATAAEKAQYDLYNIYDKAKAESYAKGAEISKEGAKGYESGGHLFATAGEKAMYELKKMTDKTAAEQYAKGHEISAKTGEGLASGAGEVQKGATIGVYDPVTNTIKQVPVGSKEALNPIEGIFSTTFLNASVAAGTQLSGLVTDVHTKMSSMSTSVATYSTSMQTNFVNGINAMKVPLAPLGEAITSLQTILSNLSTSVATYSNSMLTNFQNFANTTITEAQRIGTEAIVPLNEAFTMFSSNLIDTILPSVNDAMLNWSTLTIQEFTRAAEEGMIPYVDGFTLLEEGILDMTTKMQEYMTKWSDVTIQEFAKAGKEGILVYQKASSTLSTTVAAHTKSMASNTEIFSSAAIGSFGTAVKSGLLTYQKASSTLSTTVATHSKSMAANLKQFSSQAVSALNAVTSAANKATSALNKMAAAAKKAAAAAKGVGGGQFGASYFMRNGGSFIADHFMRYGGHSIGEYGKKELVTVTPLSDPSNLSQKSPFQDTQGINNFSNEMPIPNIAIPTNGQITQGGSNGVPALNIQVRGDIKQEFMLPSGHVYRKEISSVLFENISAITSR